MMTPEKTALDSWKSGGADPLLPPIADLRDRAGQFHRKIRRRNLLEYAGGGLALLVLVVIAWLVPITSLRIGTVLLAAGVCTALWQLRRRGTPLSPPVDGGQLSLMDFQRRELERQSKALRSATTWYLLPLVPGLMVLLGMPLIDPNWPVGDDTLLDQLSRPAFVVAMLVAVYWLNRKAANKLQAQIDEIDALRNN